MNAVSVWYHCKLCGEIFADQNPTFKPGSFEPLVRSFPICELCDEAAKEIEACDPQDFSDGPNDADIT